MFYHHCKSILKKEECEKLIALAKEKGFEKAKVQYYGEEKTIEQIRNNERVQWEDVELSLLLEKKLQNYLKEDFPYVFENFIYTNIGTVFRMYRYVPEQYFKPHKDGHILLDNGHESHITVLFYLNDTVGGETVLMPNGFNEKESHISIEPRQGDVLLFEHSVWHEGKPVLEGEKYVLRTDLFYKFD